MVRKKQSSIRIFWDITPCTLGAEQETSVKAGSKQSFPHHLLFSFGLLFGPQDDGDKYLRNVG
jgi:hypothetical protein